MRITIAHNKTKPEAVKAVDRAIDEAFKSLAIGPVEVVDQHKSWSESTMAFALTAKVGFLRYPIKGNVFVEEKDITIEADLGLLDRILGEQKVKETIEARVKGLLESPK